MAPPASHSRRPRRWRAWLLHLFRWAVLAAVLWQVRQQHQGHEAKLRGGGDTPVSVATVRPFFPEADHLADGDSRSGGQTVCSAEGRPLGYVVQTAPAGDSIIGFSGPTNTLIAFDKEQRILGLAVLRCGDTPEHLERVLADRRFLTGWNGLTWEAARDRRGVDGVSGATLTSMAIAQGIAARLGGVPHSYRFPEPLGVDDACRFFPAAASLTASRTNADVWDVWDAGGAVLGRLARTSPAGDNLIGFQGPTDTLLAFDPQGHIQGLAIRKTYETAAYMPYITEDPRFLKSFNGRTLDELAGLDLAAAGVEGASGATLTSMAIARSLVKAAEKLRAAPPPPPRRRFAATVRDAGTLAVVLAALLIGFTPLRGRRWVRVGFQGLLIGYLGGVNGDMLSLALAAGWVRTGVPWNMAPGVVLLAAAALVVPLLTRRQVYCHHLCPHGAAQQLLRHRVPWQWHVPVWLNRGLKAVPLLLIVGALLATLRRWPLSLTAIEPFHAYMFRMAGLGTLAVAGLGLAASLFVPMAYCRFGCPTGAVLNYVRLHGGADRFSARDVAALLCLALAAAV